MNLDGINLVEYNAKYMIVDYWAKKPVIISKRVYEIIMKIKSGMPISLIQKSYDSYLVDTVLNTLDNLKTRKVLDFSNKDFYTECKNAMNQYNEQEIDILEGNIMISQDCNMACRYCYGGTSGTYNKRGLMSIEMGEECFRYILSCGKSRAFQKTVFFGGEPLLNMPVIRHIVLTWEKIKNQYHGKEMYFTLTTNGTLLTSEIVEFFKEYNIIVNISLDGPKEIHDSNRILANGKESFEKVIQGIDLLRKFGLPISIRSTITKGTDLHKLQNFFEQENFDVYSIDMVDYPLLCPKKSFQFDLNSYDDFLKQQREVVRIGCEDIYKGDKNSFSSKQMSSSYQRANNNNEYPFLCGAGNWFIAIGLDGYIYPCTRLVGNEKFRIGDVYNGLCKNSMIKLWEEFLEVSNNCNSCWAASRCHGRCFHQKLNENNQMEPLPKELCDIYKESIADSLLFTIEMKKYMEEKKDDFQEAILRYNANHMMEKIRKEKNRMDKISSININKTIVLELNYHCNLQCIHCYIPGDEKKQKKYMNFEEAKKILNQVADLGFQRIVITGGEPLINPDFIKIYTYAWEKGFIISLYTNATLMTQDIKELLILKKPALIKISMFGCDEIAYTKITGQNMFSYVYRNILFLKQNKVNVAVKIPLLRQNNPNMVKKMQKELAERKISTKIEVRILPRYNGDTEVLNYRYEPEEIVGFNIDNVQRSLQMFDQVRKSNKKVKDIRKCIQCQPSVINPECRLQLCFFMREYSVDLHTIPLKMAFSTLTNIISETEIENEQFECGECDKQYMCLYCPGWAKTEVGAVNKKIPFLCNLIKGYENKYIRLLKNENQEGLSE